MHKDRLITIIKAMDIIDDNFHRDINALKHYVEQTLGYTYEYVSDLFKDELGITAHDYIIRCKENSMKDNTNQHKANLLNKLYVLDSLERISLIKKSKIIGDEISAELDINMLYIYMSNYPVIVLPQCLYIDAILRQSKDLDIYLATTQLYMLSSAFILQQGSLHFNESDMKYIQCISGVYMCDNPIVYYDYYIFTPYSRHTFCYSASLRRLLNSNYLFTRLATIYNYKVFHNTVPTNIANNETPLRLAIIKTITQQYYTNNFATLDDLISYISLHINCNKYDIYDALIGLINQGIVIYEDTNHQQFYCKRKNYDPTQNICK